MAHNPEPVQIGTFDITPSWHFIVMINIEVLQNSELDYHHQSKVEARKLLLKFGDVLDILQKEPNAISHEGLATIAEALKGYLNGFIKEGAIKN